jgi:plastocyanin
MNPKLTGVLLTMTLAALTACGGGDEKKPEPAKGGDPKAATTPAGGGAAYDAAKATGAVTVKVKWAGAAPTPGKLAPDEFCKGLNPSGIDDPRFVINADGTVPNAFVWAKDGPHKGMSGLPATPKVTLDQKNCMYVPHVFGLRAGEAFTVKNSDGTNHNVHARPALNKNEINQVQGQGGVNDFTFTQKEAALPFNCDIHSWMSAYAFVLDHPFFGTTGADGTVKIEKLPPGKYKFKVWHEAMSADVKGHEVEIDVEVAEGASATAEATLK